MSNLMGGGKPKEIKPMRQEKAVDTDRRVSQVLKEKARRRSGLASTMGAGEGGLVGVGGNTPLGMSGLQ